MSRDLSVECDGQSDAITDGSGTDSLPRGGVAILPSPAAYVHRIVEG